MGDRIGRFKNLHLHLTPAPLMRAVALRRLAAADLDFPGVDFRIAATEDEMAGAFALLEACYLRRGIAQEGQMRLQVISLLPTTTTFIACEGKRVIGTLSLIEDGDLGLPMEKVHANEVSAVRDSFRHVAEVGALAVSTEQRRSGLSLMLYNMMYRWARNWRHVDDLLIAVHPSARHFYRNLLLFQTLGPVQRYEGLRGAASLPMRLDIQAAQMQFHGLYRNAIVDRTRRQSFYDFFCAPSTRFDFSAHPEFQQRRPRLGPLADSAVMQLLGRFSLSVKEIAAPEASALQRHFPSIPLTSNGLA